MFRTRERSESFSTVRCFHALSYLMTIYTKFCKLHISPSLQIEIWYSGNLKSLPKSGGRGGFSRFHFSLQGQAHPSSHLVYRVYLVLVPNSMKQFLFSFNFDCMYLSCVYTYECRCHRTPCRSQFSLSTM